MAVTIYDIAKKANYSPSTVSLVMNDSSKISQKTKDHVRSVARELGYTPNFAAKSLINKKTNSIGIIIPNLENPLFCSMLSCMNRVIDQSGYSTVLGLSEHSAAEEKHCIQMLSEHRVDGLIIFPSYLNEYFPEFIQNKDSSQIPLVLCGSSTTPKSDISFVKCDNHIGGYIATEHLIKTGKKRIACLCATSPQQANSRISGYQDALEFYDLKTNKDLIVYCSPNYHDIADMTAALIQSQKPDAIYCLYDHMCMPVMTTILSMGLRIPEDIALIGYDNLEQSAFYPIPLSSVDTHSTTVANMSVKQLLKKISDPSTESKKIILKPDLVIRKSTYI